jgi:hypothetical protein
MSKPATPDQKAAQITETLAVHNLLNGLPEDAAAKLRHIALRERTSIMQVARQAILSFTQHRAA